MILAAVYFHCAITSDLSARTLIYFHLLFPLALVHSTSLPVKTLAPSQWTFLSCHRIEKGKSGQWQKIF